MEIRELLTSYGFPGDDTPIVRVSALKALEGDEAAGDQVMELMDAVDSFIPEPVRATEKPFLMSIEDVMSITGRGTVVTGKVEQGVVKVGDEVEIVGLRPTTKTVVTGIEMFRKLLDQGQAGDNLGALLRGTKKEDVERGQVLCKPGTIELPSGTEMVMPGDNTEMTVTLGKPIAMEEGLTFSIREMCIRDRSWCAG